MPKGVAILLISIVACAPVGQPEAIVGCYAYQHPAKTDTVFLDSVPPTSPTAVDEDSAWSRVLLFPYVSDTLTVEQRAHDIEVSMRWRRVGDFVRFVWSDGQERVTMTGRWHADSMVLQGLHRWVADSPRTQANTVASTLLRIQCPAGWPGAV